jgi:predicted nucleic acid-binding protein
MEKIFVDTSAFLAIVNVTDPFHESAMQTWQDLIQNQRTLLCNNYVLLESIALIQRRVDLQAVSILHNDIIPFMEIEWIDETLHNAIINQALTSKRRQISLVDYSSFDTMRRQDVSLVFTFDNHFRQQGFTVIP